MAPLTIGLLQQEGASGPSWLSFPRPPDASIREALKASGWRYHGGHRAWHHAARPPPVPEGVTVAVGGDTQLSTLRPRNGPEILEILQRAKAALARSTATAHS